MQLREGSFSTLSAWGEFLVPLTTGSAFIPLGGPGRHQVCESAQGKNAPEGKC